MLFHCTDLLIIYLFLARLIKYYIANSSRKLCVSGVVFNLSYFNFNNLLNNNRIVLFFNQLIGEKHMNQKSDSNQDNHLSSFHREGGDNNQDDKKKLFSDEKFHKLMEVKQAIFLETDVSAGLRKIIDKLITDEKLEEVKNELIMQFKE